MEKKLKIPAFLYRTSEGKLQFSLSNPAFHSILPSIVIPLKYDDFPEIKNEDIREISLDFNITLK